MTHTNTIEPNSMAQARESLQGKRGPEYWRSLEEWAQTPAFEKRLQDEFPLQAASPISDVTRRNFLKVMGASLALAGVTTGCARQPIEKIYPYVKLPEQIVPGLPVYFASAFVHGGYAHGVLVESHTGRPTKIEGLPDHPSSLGATDAIAQASILGLYDPDRSKSVLDRGYVAGWGGLFSEIRGTLDDLRSSGGKGICILTETVTSPTLAWQLEEFLKAFPQATWRQWDPAGRDTVREGAKLAFGEYVETVYKFDHADIIVSLDADFLSSGPAHVRYAKDFSKRRDSVDHNEDLHRIYAAESWPTNTGTFADHRLPVAPSRIETIGFALAKAAGVGVEFDAEAAGLTPKEIAWVNAAAGDLRANGGKGIVVAGDHQPAVVHALAHAINHQLGNDGQSLLHTAPIEAKPADQLAELKALVGEMNAGEVQLLLMVGGNPVFNAPADLDFAAALDKVPLRAHLSLYEDETSELCHWHAPMLHYLESWSDARAHDGTSSLVQPLIAPLYDGKTVHEMFSALTEETERSSHDIVQGYWKARLGEANFDAAWRKALSEGMIADTAANPARFTVNASGLRPSATNAADGFELVMLPDPYLWDGQYASNAWLQELPRPMSHLTWDNAAYIGYATAMARGLRNEDLVEIKVGDRMVQAPIWVQPAMPDNVVALHFGFGRTKAGLVGTVIPGESGGANVYAVRTSDAMGIARGVQVSDALGHYMLAGTDEHHNIYQSEADEVAQDRGIHREFTQREYETSLGGHGDEHEAPAQEEGGHEEAGSEHGGHGSVVATGFHDFGKDYTLLDNEEKRWDGEGHYGWGMTIDLNKCTGCNACIVACSSENNIPVVGKKEVRIGREMHWIRIDRYYKGTPDNPRIGHQPVPCQQCENATCEVVCPVGATQHSKEGLNDMVYNRCIGTRYCANNCPYKVRRFNYYNYSRTPLGKQGDRMFPRNQGVFRAAHVYPETIKEMYNPDVTVRTRGVMEKCTYCVQRINFARIEAKRDGRFIRDGEIATACQQACPSSAIVFGNINDAESAVSKSKASPRNYTILADLNNRPRTTYLAKLTNPNPELGA